MAYNSIYSGAKIDEAVGKITALETKPYLLGKSGNSNFSLNYTGTEVNTLLSRVKTDAEIQTMINTAVSNAIENFNPTVYGRSITLSGGISMNLWNIGRKLWMCEINGTTTSAISQWSTIGTLPAEAAPPWNVFIKSQYPGQTYSIFLVDDRNINSGSAIPSGTPCWYTAVWMSKN